jgi:hypothetical protein
MSRPNRLYLGRPVGVVTVRTVMQTYALEPRLELHNHSPTGFAWGYGGSGPAQLALALLADALGDDERALALYQDFKWRCVSRFAREWRIRQSRIVAVAGDIEQARAQKRSAS